MAFLEHGKKKAIVSFKNRWKLAQRNGNDGIQNPTLFAPIPIWGLDARVVAHESICLDWNLATRLENRKSAVWGRRNRGIEERRQRILEPPTNDGSIFSDLNGWEKNQPWDKWNGVQMNGQL
ncbi:hypothetical protein AVEN_114720-1 [Araneus ventricosus]|uniref:Uncharacterized protein n=1 Tax=Araneus ventricosus TaxID=182803 RepID=A0A4Y2G6E3_ARAVE|nr:hypothetical protein AVEN_114720-1 [Araneus ventricosus]